MTFSVEFDSLFPVMLLLAILARAFPIFDGFCHCRATKWPVISAFFLVLALNFIVKSLFVVYLAKVFLFHFVPSMNTLNTKGARKNNKIAIDFYALNNGAIADE